MARVAPPPQARYEAAKVRPAEPLKTTPRMSMTSCPANSWAIRTDRRPHPGGTGLGAPSWMGSAALVPVEMMQVGKA